MLSRSWSIFVYLPVFFALKKHSFIHHTVSAGILTCQANTLPAASVSGSPDADMLRHCSA
nr:hypothetical protein [Klebsiella michiganensis]UWX38085.1 hypothetical protein KJK04_p0405 [Klebsiella quasipneumoniae]